MELTSSSINKFLIFSQKKSFLKFQETFLSPKKFLTFSYEKASLIFQETETPKKSLMFQETELSYISRSKFQSSKNKKNTPLKAIIQRVSERKINGMYQVA